MILEVCVETFESIITAKVGGAHRIELCAALSEDGVTPPVGVMHIARWLFPEKMHVLIRAHGGDFVYNDDEVEMMIGDINAAREAGADGVVIGALTPEGNIDIDACRRMVKAAEGMQITFHRAFDHCTKPFEALEDIISLGCHRLLTSGQARTAIEGCELIAQLVKKSDGRIIIMPGAGVNEDNAAEILQRTGCKEIHGTIRSMTPNGLQTDPQKVYNLIRNAVLRSASPIVSN